MARPLRVEFPGAVYHVMARGNVRQAIYVDDEDRRCFLRFLGREARQQRWRCHAYCLMSNHYHLLVETPEGNLVRGMRRLNGAYAQACNRRHERVGHLFQGRYRSVMVDRQAYLLVLCRYIVLNPVRAGMVAAVERWPWSSYRGTAGLAPAEDWLAIDWILDQFSPHEESAREAYRRFVEGGLMEPSPWANVKGQVWLGGEEFLQRMEHQVRGMHSGGIPQAQLQPARPGREEVLAAVQRAYGLAASPALDRATPEAFQAAVYLLRRAANLSLKDVAALAGVSAGRISQIQRSLESGRVSAKQAGLLEHYKVKI